MCVLASTVTLYSQADLLRTVQEASSNVYYAFWVAGRALMLYSSRSWQRGPWEWTDGTAPDNLNCEMGERTSMNSNCMMRCDNFRPSKYVQPCVSFLTLRLLAET
jgi:hypothetical protein